MKKLFVILTSVLLSTPLITYSQLKVLTNGSTQGGSTAGALRIETNYKYVDIGCKASNGFHTHFYTNSSKGYWFDKEIMLGTGSLSSYTGDLTFITKNLSRMEIGYDYGHVAIGTDPKALYLLYVNGATYINGLIKASDFVEVSDINFKEDITSFPNDRISGIYTIGAKKYKLKDKSEKKVQDISEKDINTDSTYTNPPVEEDPYKDHYHIGFIAQDIKDLYPELVYEDEEGLLYLSYDGFIPIIVEALKEQKNQIEELQEKIKEKDKNLDLKNSSKSLTITDAMQASEPFLGHNMPNPFNENTTIEYFLPSTIQKAQLYIYDMQGKQIKSINLVQREIGQVVIYGNELSAGIYQYSIIADGQIIGMERMVLTD